MVKKLCFLLITLFLSLAFVSCSSQNSNNNSTDLTEKETKTIITPSHKLLDVYGKSLYELTFKNGKAVFSSRELNLDNSDEKSTWTVAWFEDDTTAIMKKAYLVIEADGKEIYKKRLEIKAIDNENDYIHGWNRYVLCDEVFSTECDEKQQPKASIQLTDSNRIEYDVLLEPTVLNEPNENGGTDNSNRIIIKDGDETYFLEDTYE